MSEIKKHYSFLMIGETRDDSEVVGEGFKRYVGLGASKILALNPTKEKLDEIMGYASNYEPQYVEDKDGEKQANIHFIVETDPELCNGIDIKQKAMFTIRPKPALSSDGTTVQVIDDYGNYARANYEDAKAHKPLPSNKKIDQINYRIACEGEVDLTVFLKKLLVLPSSMNYVNGTWVLKDDASKGKFRLENLKDLVAGNFSEIQEALNYRPNNKIQLLYGVKTVDGKPRQVVCTNADLTLRNNASASDVAKVASSLASAKAAGKYANIEYAVQELKEWDVQPTNLASAPKEDSSSEMPWES